MGCVFCVASERSLFNTRSKRFSPIFFLEVSCFVFYIHIYDPFWVSLCFWYEIEIKRLLFVCFCLQTAWLPWTPTSVSVTEGNCSSALTGFPFLCHDLETLQVIRARVVVGFPLSCFPSFRDHHLSLPDVHCLEYCCFIGIFLSPAVSGKKINLVPAILSWLEV